MSLERVRAWRDRLRADRDAAPDVGLSTEGRGLVIDDALDALTDDALVEALSPGGAPFDRAVVVAARTVVSAPIEWLALLLARGTDVVLKHPAGAAGLAPWFVSHAEAVGLPLVATEDRGAVNDAPLVVAMGDDDTIASLRASLDPSVRFLGFGSRFSVAWWSKGSADADVLARDLAAHDGRGCMSPAMILTDDPDGLLALLPDAMARAQARWPRGEVSAIEHATTRSRAVLARATGRAIAGEGWAVHLLPAEHASKVSLPRAAQIIGVADIDAALALVAKDAHRLSTIGVASQGAAKWATTGAPRVVALGQMQRPVLVRRHDGVPHLTLLVR